MFDQPPASESTDVSFFTALTQPATQLQDDDASTVSESQNPYDNLWGRFVPCNPSVPAIDFKDSQPTYTIGRNQNNHIVVAAAKISKLSSPLAFYSNLPLSSPVEICCLSAISLLLFKSPLFRPGPFANHALLPFYLLQAANIARFS